PLLTAELKNPNVRVKLAALYVSENLEAEAAGAAEALVTALADESPFVRWGAVRALGRMAPQQADKAVPALAKLLADANGDVRITTAAALVRYGPAAKPAVAALRKAFHGASTPLSIWIMRALMAVGAEARPAVPELILALS